MEKKNQFRWKPWQFTNRVGFDLRPESYQCLGLIRAIKVQELDDPQEVESFGQYLVTVVSIEDGHLQECYFNENEVGYLDLHPAIFYSAEELFNAMNTLRQDVEFYRSWGSLYTYLLQEHYDQLIEDAKAILLINHCFNLHDYKSMMTQHILMGLA